MSKRSATASAATLVELVTDLPGVAGIEPGIASTLRTLDLRLRSAASELTGVVGDEGEGVNGNGTAEKARYGVVIDDDAVTVEVGLEIAPRAVRETVADIQSTVTEALGESGAGRTVLVKVQSLS